MTDIDKTKLRFVSTAKGTTVVGNIFENRDYLFIQKNKKSVVVFSKIRVPFDMPKNDVEPIKALKKDLINAINEMIPLENCILQARYGMTNKKSFYDVENILFYNIGTVNFNSLTNQGVIFLSVSEKEIEDIRNQLNIPDVFNHYYEYSIVEKENEKSFNELLAEWKNISLKCIGLKVSECWKCMKREQEKIKTYNMINCENGEKFSLVLEIEKPKNARFNVMVAMKPLLDGLICSFHRSKYDDNELKYFSKILNCEKDILNDTQKSVLGERKSKFLHVYRENLKWNPADDLCHYVSISIVEGDSWKFSGKIYALD